jgi:hypothetical protein
MAELLHTNQYSCTGLTVATSRDDRPRPIHLPRQQPRHRFPVSIPFPTTCPRHFRANCPKYTALSPLSSLYLTYVARLWPGLNFVASSELRTLGGQVAYQVHCVHLTACINTMVYWQPVHLTATGYFSQNSRILICPRWRCPSKTMDACQKEGKTMDAQSISVCVFASSWFGMCITNTELFGKPNNVHCFQ